MAVNLNNGVADKALSTVVRNVSGKKLFFAYLGTHGIDLPPNAQYIHRGDLSAWCATRRRGRWSEIYERDLRVGYLRLESTPAVVMYDNALSKPRQLALNNNVLGFEDPLTGPSPDSSFVPG